METDLDRLDRAMEAAPESDAVRLAFYDRLADAELYLLLAREPAGDAIEPALFDLAEGRVALAFDREERLAAFADGPAPYAALPGRVVARMLAAEGLGLGLNLGVAPSAFLMPAEALAASVERRRRSYSILKNFAARRGPMSCRRRSQM